MWLNVGWYGVQSHQVVTVVLFLLLQEYPAQPPFTTKQMTWMGAGLGGLIWATADSFWPILALKNNQVIEIKMHVKTCCLVGIKWVCNFVSWYFTVRRCSCPRFNHWFSELDMVNGSPAPPNLDDELLKAAQNYWEIFHKTTTVLICGVPKIAIFHNISLYKW